MVFGADDDPERRLVELRRRRAELDEEIARAERGEVDRPGRGEPAGPLPAVLAHRPGATGRLPRGGGELPPARPEPPRTDRRLDGLQGRPARRGRSVSRNSIAESDQGRSFQAFYDFLLSHQRQAELTDLLERLGQIDEIGEPGRAADSHPLRLDRRQRADAGDGPAALRAAAALPRRPGVAREPAGLRPAARHRVQGAAVSGTVPAARSTMEMDDTRVSVDLPTERPLYRGPTGHRHRQHSAAGRGRTTSTRRPCVSQMYVDRDRPAPPGAGTRWGHRDQVGLREVVAGDPAGAGTGRADRLPVARRARARR